MTPTRVTYVALSQYGRVHLCTTPHPRKELLDLCDRRHAERMYIDTHDGPACIGYVIAGEWWTLYRVAGRGPAS